MAEGQRAKRGASGAAAHIRRTIARYERDLGLMQGRISAAQGDLDDLAILDRFSRSGDRQRLISDRKLRIKTLQATLDILAEEAEA